jgi:hypothetical protein
MNILLCLLILCLIFFIIHNKEGFVQNYDYPVPLEDTSYNKIISLMKNPLPGTTFSYDIVKTDLNLFNNASNILYGMQRIPLPELPRKYSD